MAYVCVILAAVLFGAAPTVQKLVLLSGATPEALMAVSNGITVLGALAVALVKRYSLRVTRRQLLQLMLMGLCIVSTGLLLAHAYSYLPVGFASMIHFLYPTVVCAAMTLLFHERLTAAKCAAVAVSIGGLVLLGGGSAAAGGSGVGVRLAALSSLTYASYVILNDKGGANTLPLVVKLIYSTGTSMAVCLVTAAVRDGVYPAGGRAWGLSLLTGTMFGLAYFFLTAGIRRLGAAKAAFINMLEPVTSLLVSAAVYHYAISGASLLGSALVLCSVLLIARGGRKNHA